MSEEARYLRPDAIIEPLVDGFYAWLHTVAPVQPALYRSEYYSESRQAVQLSLETGVERPFILSTPRLPGPDVIHLDLPFRHEGITELFLARTEPTTLGRLREALELDDAQAAQLA